MRGKPRPTITRFAGGMEKARKILDIFALLCGFGGGCGFLFAILNLAHSL